VKLFARARDLAGTETLAIRLSAGATVAELRRAICEVCPKLKTLSGGLLVAVNAKYAGDATTLSTGDEVACFPPVSGG
jgi:sulfur-carrier protein